MDLYSWKIKEKEMIQLVQSIEVGNLGAVGCNHECFLYHGGDDWESFVFIVKKE